MSQQNKSHTPFTNSEIIEKVTATAKIEELENLGKTISASQFLDILFAISHHHLPVDKLSPLLVGISNETFCEALWMMSEPLVRILVQQSSSEPLLHHLTMFVANCALTDEHILKEIEKIKSEIANIEWSDLGYETVFRWHKQIEEMGSYYCNLIQSIHKALEIGWSSERIDLIEKLSKVKEHAFHLLRVEFGYPDEKELPQTGLMMFLKSSLEKIYDSSELNNDDPSIEGLICFSVWYLKDYWEVGLLPKVKKIEDLEAPQGSSESKVLSYKKKLFQSVSENLKKLNLKTINDLKESGIYSKKMLAQYIAHHATMLESNP